MKGTNRWLSVFATLASIFVLSPSVGGQDTDFWGFLKEGQVVTRCQPASTDHEQARTRLERLDTRVRSLRNDAAIADVVAELHGLFKTGCFLAAAETERVPRPDTALSLKEWWTNGGEDWLASFLELPRLGLVDNLQPHVVVPADARTTLNLEAHRNHPLKALLCPLADAACGAETRGWRLRAEAYFEFHLDVSRRQLADTPFARPESNPEDVSDQCAADTAGTAGERYEQWRACVESRRPTRVALPLGEFKAPATGWLVVTGRRGHYSFCDTIRAYNLADGAAFILDSCSDLVLKPGGDVDRNATNKARAERVSAGRISVENLREALWMMLLRSETEEIQLRAEFYPLPAGLIPQATAGARRNDDLSAGMWGNTAQTVLTWRWAPSGEAMLAGGLTWPNSDNAAESHASSLLAIAEDGFAEGCAGQVPDATTTSRQVRNLNEVSADDIRELDRGLRKAAGRWRALPGCHSGAR